MKRIAVIFLAIFLILVLFMGINCSSNGDDETLPEGYRLYQNAENGFRLYYPENWQQIDISGVVVYFTIPDIDISQTDIDEFQADIYVSIDSAEDKSLEEFISTLEDTLTDYISEDATISNENSIEVQGRIGHEWIVSWTLEGIQLKMKQVFFITSGKLYVLNCTARKDSYDDYVDTFDTIINSFKIE